MFAPRVMPLVFASRHMALVVAARGMPLVFAAMVGIARGQSGYWLLGAVAYALLIATHPPSVLIFSFCAPL